MNERMVNDVMARAVEYYRLYDRLLDEQYEGRPIGHHRPDDAQFMVWFEGMMAQNPNWVLALPYVEGGKAELKRYARLRALRDEGVVEGVVLSAAS